MALILRPPGIPDTLPIRLAELGRSRKRVALAGGLFTCSAFILSGIALACVLDAGFHLPPVFRGIELVAILGLTGVLWIRTVSRPSRFRTDPLSVALELEKRYPSLNDTVASAVSFLTANAEHAGVSNRLQKVVVRSAERLVDRYEFGRLIPRLACWRSWWLLVIVLAIIAPLVLVNLGRALTALVRLADPFGTHPWPSKTQLEILVPETFPTRMPKGEPFQLKFGVRGVIKDRAAVSFRLIGGEEFTEEFPLVAGPDSKAPTLVTAQIDPARLPVSFSFRIISNDADTGWQRVDVIPPPRLVDLNGRPSPQFQITPPGYTGLPAMDLPDGAVALEIPAGTLVQLRAKADVRLQSATLSLSGDKPNLDLAAALAPIGHLNPIAAASASPLADCVGSDIPLTLDGERRVLSVAFRPSMTGIYVLKLWDETGLPGSRLIDIRLIPDPAPLVSLLHPAPGRDSTIFTPESSISIQLSVEDKLYGLRSEFLEYRVGKDGATRLIGLKDLRTLDCLLPTLVGGLGGAVRLRPTSSETTVRLPISAFKRDDGAPVRSGDSIFINGAADDWDDVNWLKAPGRSGEVEIQIASLDTIEAWLQKELATLRPELVRLREQQRESRQKASEAIPLPNGTLAPADRDKLLGSEQLQRQIRGKVSDPRDGVRVKAELLLDTIRTNKLPKSNTSSRVETVAQELARIADRDLSAIEASLGEARQVGGQPARMGQEHVVPDHLKKADRHQKAVVDGLTDLLDLLAVWGGAGEIRVDARILRDQVNRHVLETEKLGEKVPSGKEAESLNPSQRADLERAAGKAELAAEQAGSILARAARLAGEKDKQAADAKAASANKAAQAEALEAKANALQPGNPEKSLLKAQASALKSEADELKAASEKAAAEAAALRKGIADAGGQTMTDELRSAAKALRENHQSEAANLERSAAARLGSLADALNEKQPETAPDLAKLKSLADEFDALASAQDQLRKQAAEAAKIPDARKREAELKRLAVEQEKLIEQGKDLLQRLTRERADDAARDARAALNQMETARDELEHGKAGSRPQDEAIERLDTARDRLDTAAKKDTREQISDENRRKIADKVKALLERQKAAAAEADRIHDLVSKNKKWERPLLTSYADLEERERVLAGEVRQLSEKEFAPFPVLARLLTEASSAMELAAEKTKIRREDALDADATVAFDSQLEAANDLKVKKPILLATRRLSQLLEALQQEQPKAALKKEETTPAVPKNPMDPMPKNGGEGELIPPLAQLKVLKALQAELNEKTAEFAKGHPDQDKLTEEERAELKELEEAQRQIAVLFEELAKLFQERQP